jgi:ribonucleoside-diphosphate reductase alpha chain
MVKKLNRPNSLSGFTSVSLTGCGKIYTTVNFFEKKPFEVFVNMGKAGVCASAQCESLGRLISYALRIGGELEEIIKELSGVRCQHQTDEIKSCSDAVSQSLKKAIENQCQK